MSTLAQDVRYAVRMLRRSPGFAAVAILTLGLGIGATTTIFSVVHGVLLRPLPYRDPSRLANIWVDLGVGNQSLPAVAPGDFRDYQEQATLFEAFAAGSGSNAIGATGVLTGTSGEAERVDVIPITANFFTLLGVDPAFGRHFLPEEEAPGGPAVVILSHPLWKRRYGADPGVVGRTIRLDGRDHLVVGVMPERFRLLLPAEAFLITDAQVWTPLQFDYRRTPPRNFTFFTVLARLRPDVTLAEAQAEMDGIARQLRAEHAEHEASDMRIRVVPLQQDVVKHAEPALVALFGAVGFVLLIACANVAHLLLARSTAREREIAVRGALGAGGLRLLRQLTTESAVLGLAGAAAGVTLAAFLLSLLKTLSPANLPRLADVEIDLTVLLFALGATAVTVLAFGIAPAIRAIRLDVNRTLRAGTAPAATPAQLRLRHVLVVGEIALALVLLVGAGLMVRSFQALQRVEPGFEAEGALTFRIALPVRSRPQADARRAYVDELQRRLQALPGVTAVGFTLQLPLTGSGPLQPYAYDEATARNWESATSDRRGVSPDYFAAMGTRVLAGRVFDEHDLSARRTIIIDETLAARVWPAGDAVGKRLQVEQAGAGGDLTAEVIGVVEHMRILDLTRDVRPQIWVPFRGFPSGTFYGVVRTGSDPASLGEPVRRTVAALDPEAAVDRVRPMTAYVEAGLAQARLNLVLMTGFGLAAVLLAVVGIYGVISFSVSQRTREIGIRMALGQEPARVRNLILLQGLRLVIPSLALGVAAALPLTRLVSGLLHGVDPLDPLTFGSTIALLGL
ncbi:MAG TPA: ABC transporter permease, partial [Vicinamibacterales bacterium]|nr:ABC transporter permease [Vicinamibacterales bacterium]